MADEDILSQMIADVGNAIMKYPRPTIRKQLIEQLGETYRVLSERFKYD